jgi:hypothetical protein
MIKVSVSNNMNKVAIIDSYVLKGISITNRENSMSMILFGS